MSATLGSMSQDTRGDGNRRRHLQKHMEHTKEGSVDRQRSNLLGQSHSEPGLPHASIDASGGFAATLPVLADVSQGSGHKVIPGLGRQSPKRAALDQFDKVHLPELMSRGYGGAFAETQKQRKRRPKRAYTSDQIEQDKAYLKNRSKAAHDRQNAAKSTSPKRKFLATQLHHTALQENPFPRSPKNSKVFKALTEAKVAPPFSHSEGSLAIATQTSVALHDTSTSLEEQRWLTTTLTKSPKEKRLNQSEPKSPEPAASGLNDTLKPLLLPVVTIKTSSPPESSRMLQSEENLPSCGTFASPTKPSSRSSSFVNSAKPRSRSVSPSTTNIGSLNLPPRGTSGGSVRTSLSARRTPVSSRRRPSASGTGGTSEECPDTSASMVNAPADSIGDPMQNEAAKKDDELPCFDEDGILRLRGAFFCFTEPYSADLCIGSLTKLLKYLGHQVTNATSQGVMDLVKEITPYEYLNFDEFLSFMGKYVVYEKEQFRIEFERADEDNSGELSVLELREVMKSLGIHPLNAMVREAVFHVDKDCNCHLDFDEFMTFLNVYRHFEGFTSREVTALHKSYDHFAGDGTFWVESLCPALIHFYGRHIAERAKIVEQELLERMRLEGRVDTSLTFEDLLILARRVRESCYEGELARTQSTLSSSADKNNCKHYREFVGADKDKNNLISTEELRALLMQQGYEPLADVLNEVYDEVLEDGWQPGHELDFDQFFDFLLVYRHREGFSKSHVEDMLSVFQQFDEDGSESISSLELDDIFRHLGYSLNMEDIHHYLHIVDEDKSNELDFREFLHLMQLHRCSEIQEMRCTFKLHCSNEATSQKKVKVSELSKQTTIEALADCGYQELPEGLEIPDTTDFDSFVSLADKCRTIFVANERRKAGYADNEIIKLRESFDNFDTDKSGTIDCSELASVLESLDWKPKTVEERNELLGRLEKARVLAKEAGVQEVTAAGSAEVSFWEFIQLKRMIQRYEDTAHEERMQKLMKELAFTVAEAEEFREIFRGWVEIGDGEEVDEESPDHLPIRGAAHDKGNLSKRAIRQQVRSLCGKISSDRRRALENQLADLDDHNAGLDFEQFLRLMRWLLDTHFMDDVFKKADKAEQPFHH